MRIAVVGAGVIGTTTAVAVKEAFPGLEVTLIADVFTPDTTGDGSAGLWSPYLLADTDPEKIKHWSALTHKWMENFWKNGLAAEVGVSLIPIYRFVSDPKGCEMPEWASVPYGTHLFTKEEISRLNKRNKWNYSGGLHFLTYTFEPKKFLPWLMQRFISMNGKIIKRKVNDLRDLKKEGYDVVINCTGFGSKELLSDQLITPIRGQIIKVNGPWLFDCFLEDDEHKSYIIPNMHSVILGGTHQEGDLHGSVRPMDSKRIREGCQRINPSTDKCKLLSEWVGFRPGRSAVRLEPEILKVSENTDLLIIHNYGHGGSGITLCWGCALDVVDLLRQQLKIKNLSKM